MMVDALLALGKTYINCPHCIHRKLGQQFDSHGNIVHKNLYCFNYVDKSNFQWAFAFVVDEVNDIIKITKMMPARFVTESTDDFNPIISESINKLINEIIDEDKRRRIQRIVCETTDKYINKMIA